MQCRVHQRTLKETHQECWFSSFPENLNLEGLLHFPYLQFKKNKHLISGITQKELDNLFLHISTNYKRLMLH